jgi:NAD dependent epimerase/dehydratase family enzyme
MRIVIAGGTGHLGRLLVPYFRSRGDHVSILTRGSSDSGRGVIHWDGRTLGDWTEPLDGADAVINLATSRSGSVVDAKPAAA